MPDLAYGSHPHRLDDLLRTFTQEERGNCQILTQEQSRALEQQSIERLPQTAWGTIDWPENTLIEQYSVPTFPEVIRHLSESLERYAPAVDAVIFWANLVVPSLAVPTDTVVAHLDEVLATSHDVWIFVPERRLVFEYFHDGRVTVARVPTNSPMVS